jgi:hypothetical protein
MNTPRIGYAVLGGALAYCLAISECSADVTFLTPTPYLSAADSPFPIDGSNPNFFLENFEDGQLNTLGIEFWSFFADPPYMPTGSVLEPSVSTDSVDADDGAVDGNGQLGHSCRSELLLQTASLPPITQMDLIFDFDEELLGHYPNAFGFVWTDGPADFALSFRVTTSQGDEFALPMVSGVLDGDRDGGTVEDRFFGARCQDGIAHVSIRATYTGDFSDVDFFEIDHVQYGLLVPEPNSMALTLMALGSLLVCRRACAPMGG